ncbi:MAG: hypothetical protein FJ290_33280, partial [Planctomycetes bacterium]|nr:hypothetical protein [Planctomycetota bacterium]
MRPSPAPRLLGLRPRHAVCAEPERLVPRGAASAPYRLLEGPMARTRGTGKGRMRWLGLGLAAATRAVLWLARAAATAIGSLVARNRTRREAQDPAGRERARLAALLSGMRRRAEEATREATQRAEELASARKALLHIVRDLESARAAAEAANNAKSQFLANMSHEIRTPMNAILGFAKLLLREPLSDGQRSCVETICRSGNHLMALINDILDLSKIEADRVELHLEVVDVGLAARGVCELLGPRAAEKGLALAVEVHPSTPAGATTDPGCLRQILMNLVGNALKFTDHGSVTVRVGPPAPAPPSCPLPLGEGRVRAPGATQPPLSGALSPALSQGERGQCLLPAEEGERREMIHFAVADTGIGIPA